VKTLSIAVLLILGCAHAASAQLHGFGFVQGKIVDERGAPVPDVTFFATLPRVGGRLAGVSDQKGEWKIVGMAHGEWEITFEKSTYTKRSIKLILESELARVPPITVKLKPAS